MFDCRVFSQEIPTDLLVEVGGASFNLHKVHMIHLIISFVDAVKLLVILA